MSPKRNRKAASPESEEMLSDTEEDAGTGAAAEERVDEDVGVAEDPVQSSDVNADRRVREAAATLGGAAGVLASGPVVGVALAAAAAYSTTRENTAGRVIRKASTAYLQVADEVADRSFKVADQAVTQGCKQLARHLQHVDLSGAPAPVQQGFRQLKANLAPTSKRVAAAEREEAKRMLEKHPDRIPVFCEPASYSDLPEIAKRKFLVKGSMLCGEFKYLVHKQVVQAMPGGTGADRTIYIFVNGLAPKTSTPMSELYAQMPGTDKGFLNVTYGAENTLGR